MLVLGHAGITLGTATLLAGIITRAKAKRPKTPPTFSEERSADTSITSAPASWFVRLNNWLDIRALLVGSLLPDIIDKPLGHVLLRDSLSSGRLFCHTLLFTILIALAGLFLHRRTSKTWLLALSFGTFAHLILDKMWQEQWRAVLLWPFYGLEFPRVDLIDWIKGIWHALLHDPAVYVPEIIGGVVIILFLWVLVRNGKLATFFKRGRLSDA